MPHARTFPDGSLAATLDANYNDTLGPAHEDAVADAEPLEIAGLDPARIEVRVVAPVDLAISKLERFGDYDRDDMAAIARAGGRPQCQRSRMLR